MLTRWDVFKTFLTNISVPVKTDDSGTRVILDEMVEILCDLNRKKEGKKLFNS